MTRVLVEAGKSISIAVGNKIFLNYNISKGEVFMTMTLEIENPAVIGLIRQLEGLQMLSVVNSLEKPKVDWRKYRGSVSKQDPEELEKELADLRNEWERDIF